MAKEYCPNCETRLTEPVSFCPSCQRPTRHADDAERLDWDLKQWRAHVDRSVAAGVNPSNGPSSARAGVIVASATKPRPPIAPLPTIAARVVEANARMHAQAAAVATVPANLPVPEPRPAPLAVVADPAPAAVEEAPKPRRARQAKKPRLPRVNKRDRAERDAVVADPDLAFAYRACATCSEKDWIIRTTRNDDETWNYWCVRCSRSFKTEVKLRHAVKPFLCSGIVVGGLTAASTLMLR